MYWNHYRVILLCVKNCIHPVLHFLKPGISDLKKRTQKVLNGSPEKLCALWGDGAAYEIDSNPQPHEANYLKLDCTKSNSILGLAAELEYRNDTSNDS